MSKKINVAMNIGFVLSLILNGFLLGFILSGPPIRGGMPPPDPSKRLYEAANDLSPENRDKIITILDERTRKIDKKMRGEMDGFKDIRSALTADKLDLEKLDEAFKSIDVQHIEVGSMLSSMMKDIAAAIPDTQERVRFFERALPPEPPRPPPSQR